jgi:molybdopterin converting factor small subunit
VTVAVLYFGVLKDAAGGVGGSLVLAEGATVAALLDAVGPNLALAGAAWRSVAVAVNREYAARETVLRDGDEVALLPPVSGGVYAG